MPLSYFVDKQKINGEFADALRLVSESESKSKLDSGSDSDKTWLAAFRLIQLKMKFETRVIAGP